VIVVVFLILQVVGVLAPGWPPRRAHPKRAAPVTESPAPGAPPPTA
jgi:hypothetical protein